MTTRTGCCAMMAAQLTQVYPDHPEPADCPDRLVSYTAETDTYGLWIMMGAAQAKSLEATRTYQGWWVQWFQKDAADQSWEQRRRLIRPGDLR